MSENGMDLRDGNAESLLGKHVKLDGMDWCIFEVCLTMDCTMLGIETIIDGELKSIKIGFNEFQNLVRHEEEMATRKVRGF